MIDSQIARWVAEAKAGDPKAKEILYLLMREKLLPVVRRSRLDKSLAEDMVHNAYLVFLAHPETLLDPEKFLEFEARIVWRYVKREMGRNLKTDHPFEGEEIAQEDLTKRNVEAEEWYASVMEQLTPKEVELFRLLFACGLPSAEACATLQVSPAYLRVSKVRLILKLRAKINRFCM